jgi:hypothetical protein
VRSAVEEGGEGGGEEMFEEEMFEEEGGGGEEEMFEEEMFEEEGGGEEEEEGEEEDVGGEARDKNASSNAVPTLFIKLSNSIS